MLVLFLSPAVPTAMEGAGKGRLLERDEEEQPEQQQQLEVMHTGEENNIGQGHQRTLHF